MYEELKRRRILVRYMVIPAGATACGSASARTTRSMRVSAGPAGTGLTGAHHARTATIERKTAETDIRLEIDLDGTGRAEIATGVGFFDHMLTLLAKHAAIDLKIEAHGDLHVDQHHTVEDVGICLGLAVRQALGDRAGIRRYGHFTLPMDETLATCAIDLGGRPYFVFQVEFPTAKIGEFDSELVADFWHAFAVNVLGNVHILVPYGRNSHHIAEGIFKSAARALRMALEADPRITGVPSTKGVL